MSKIDAKLLNQMFNYSGVDKDSLYAALKKMGRARLKPHLRQEWSPDNPTRNYCYVIAEFVFQFIAPEGSQAYRLEIPGDLEQHYLVRWPNGTWIDLAAEQFPDYAVVSERLELAKKAKFQHPSPSRRAKELAILVGIDDDPRLEGFVEEDMTAALKPKRPRGRPKKYA